MKRFYIFTIICAVMLWMTFEARTQEHEPAHIAYTKNFLRNYPERLNRALALMPVVEEHSAVNELQPIVPVVVMSLESSFRTHVIGSERQEVGLMQVHGVCARGQDLSTPEGQIQAGIECLAMARDACNGSIEQMICMYASGSCVPRTKRTKALVKRRVRLIEKWSDR